MREPSADRVLQRWADAERQPLKTTVDLKAEIAALDLKVKSLNYQKSQATSLGRRNSLIHAVNAVIRERNQLAEQYNRLTGRI